MNIIIYGLALFGAFMLLSCLGIKIYETVKSKKNNKEN